MGEGIRELPEPIKLYNKIKKNKKTQVKLLMRLHFQRLKQTFKNQSVGNNKNREM